MPQTIGLGRHGFAHEVLPAMRSVRRAGGS